VDIARGFRAMLVTVGNARKGIFCLGSSPAIPDSRQPRISARVIFMTIRTV
jgi:hypothetical protein